MAHPVIRKLLAADIPRREKYLGSTHRSLYDAPYFDSPFEQRRLRALNALFLCLETNDARVTCLSKNPQDFNVKVGVTDVLISIDDPKAERSSWYRAADIAKAASSQLVVKIDKGAAVDGMQATWQDRSDDRVEKHLTDVAVNVLVAGESTCREKENSRYQWLVEYKACLIERAKREEGEDRASRARAPRQRGEGASRPIAIGSEGASRGGGNSRLRRIRPETQREFDGPRVSG